MEEQILDAAPQVTAEQEEELRLASERPDGWNGPIHEQFRPTTTAEVEWVVGRIVQADRDLADLKARYEKMAAEITKRRDFFEGRYGCYLADYLTGHPLYVSGKAKSIKLLTGTIGTRHVNPLILFDAEKQGEMETWVRENLPEAITVIPATEKISQSVVKDALNIAGDVVCDVVCDANGETIPWASVRPAEDRLYVK